MKIWKVALAAVAIVAFAGMAGRLVMAQSDEETPTDEERPNFLARLAENLGISEDELQSAIQTTQLELLDEAVAAGRIDEERAAEIRERIESGEGFKFGFGFGHGPGHHRPHHGVDEVADFLGVEECCRSDRTEGGPDARRDRSSERIERGSADRPPGRRNCKSA